MNSSPRFPSWIHGGVEDDEFPTAGDSVDEDPCDVLLELQEDSDLTDDDEEDMDDFVILDDALVFNPLGTDLHAFLRSWTRPSRARTRS